MSIAKSLVGATVFLVALSLFLFGPEHGEGALKVGGLELDSRTATALSIIGMVFGAILTARSLAERHFAVNGRVK